MTVVPLLLTSLRLLGKAATMVSISWSPVSRASTRSWKVYVPGRVCAVGAGSVELMGKGAVMFVTLCVSGVVWGGGVYDCRVNNNSCVRW